VVGKKVRLATKQHQTMEKSSPQHELRLLEGINQSVDQSVGQLVDL